MNLKQTNLNRFLLAICVLLCFCSAAFADESYNVQTYGVVGNGTTDDRPALNTLITTTLGAKGGVIYFPNTGTTVTNYLIGSNITFPKNIILKFDVGARLKLASGVIVTLDNAPQAGQHQIFSVVNHLGGNGEILFGTQVTAYAQWWGAIDDAGSVNTSTPTGTDNSVPFQLALNTLNESGGGTLDVRTKNGFLFAGRTGLNMDEMRNITILGNAGRDNYLAGSKNLIFTGAPTNAISAKSSFHLVFDSVGIHHTSNLFTGALLLIGSTGADPAYHIIRDCNFSARDEQNPTAEAGIKFENAIVSNVEKSGFQGLITGIKTSGYANVISVRENIFVYNQSYGIDLAPGAESWLVEQNTFEGGSNDTIGKGLTRALRASGSVWALSFKDNWLGDGTGGLASDDAMVDVKHVYGLVIENNRFANYGATAAFGIHIEDCLSPAIRNNRFEYMPAINATAATGYTYGLTLQSNNYNAGAVNLGGVIGLTKFDGGGENKLTGALLLSGNQGTDPVGESTMELGLGTVYGSDDTAPKTRYGGGIRMSSSLSNSSSTGFYNDGSMLFTTRQDLWAPFIFRAGNSDRFVIGATVQSNTDVFINDSTKGMILKSPDGTCYRFTVANGGSLNSGVAVTCP